MSEAWSASHRPDWCATPSPPRTSTSCGRPRPPNTCPERSIARARQQAADNGKRTAALRADRPVEAWHDSLAPRQITPQQGRRYALFEIVHTNVSLLAALLFIIGGVSFSLETAKRARTFCFLIGSDCFAAEPPIRRLRDLWRASVCPCCRTSLADLELDQRHRNRLLWAGRGARIRARKTGSGPCCGVVLSQGLAISLSTSKSSMAYAFLAE